ncbi:CYB5D2 isoform 1 [Pan troglodytes]|uniref:CYB5D2 isoform 1 n=3 Tax=Pan TaxID=9596 RepID=A0A6D2X440_PANTR|nr:CYB5D2 isoform 1 [Pan troglodytes]
MLTLHNWLSFYEKNYVCVGRVTGRFYGEDGLPTPALTQVEAAITRGLEANKLQLQEKQTFPPCNAEWSSARGSRLWCSQKSSFNRSLALASGSLKHACHRLILQFL